MTTKAVPSIDPADLVLNAGILDAVVNSTSQTFTDRLGVVKPTVLGAIETLKAFNSRGAWATATAYAVKDLVSSSGSWYVCVVAHTSSAALATDLATKWRVYQGILAGELSASSGSSLVGFMPSGSGAVALAVQEYLRILQARMVSVKESPFFAKGDGSTDDTAAVQACLDYCYANTMDMHIPKGAYLLSDQVKNKGVSMYGESRLYSQFLLATTFPSGKSVILVQPDSGAYIDFLELTRFSVQPTNGGTKYGGVALYMNFPVATNLSRLHVHNLYLMPGNDYSFWIENNNVINAQGVPANSVIERNAFWEGMNLNKIGDSVSVRNNILRSSGGNRTGVKAYISDTSGVASHLIITENNIDCVGGAVLVLRGRNVKVRDNNIELSAGSGTPSGSVIDIDGSSGNIPWAEVESNHVGIFGTGSASSAIRINGAVGCSVDKNTILAGYTTAAGIFITSSAGDTDVGFNEIQSTFTAPINNLGLRTIGMPLALGMLNSFVNTGGGYQALSAIKSRNGLVTLGGVVNAPASPSGVIIATLPLGYRPTTIQRFSVSTVTSGLIVGCAAEVDVAGNIVAYCSAGTTRIEFAATFQTNNYVSGAL